MSEKLPENINNEEVDLGQLFNAIGKLFDRLFSFITRLFKGLFSTIIYALKPLVNNIKPIAIAVMLAAIVGYGVEKFSEPIYSSSMLVRPYFESKYKLANDIDYLNVLIGSGNLNELEEFFEIDSNRASQLIGFDLEIGPETSNDLLKEYNNYIKTIDTALVKNIPYEEYVDNRDVLSANIFSIKAKSKTRDIFKSLENGFEKTFKNTYSKKVKNIRDESINVEIATYKKELKRIDSIQNIYFDVLKEESKKSIATIGGEGMPMISQKTTTREYDLFKREIIVRDSLKILNQELIIENDYYDTISGFEQVGTAEKGLLQRYSIVFPGVALFLMIIVFILFKAFQFISDYE